jgi:retron-type reverse transcriptase
MKRVGNLWEGLTSFENLLGAAEAAAAGKRKKAGVAEFLLNLEPELARLRRELLERGYEPGGYHTFTILDPKPRLISAAPFRDRVVHHALTRVLEPIFEKRFSPNSFACRVGMGTHKALARAKEGMREYPFVLKADVRKYFASIDHEILNGLLARTIKCRPTLDLAARIIAGSNTQEEVIRYFPGDDLFTPYERRRGLPLGNQTSQFFANVYLSPLDRLLDERLRPGLWVRYVDDLLVFDTDKQRLREMRAALAAELARLRLGWHEAKTRIHRAEEGVTFLGWRLRPGRARLVRSNVMRFSRRLRRLRRRFAAGAAEWEEVHTSVRAWIAHASSGDTWRLRERLLERSVFRRGAWPERAGGFVQQ